MRDVRYTLPPGRPRPYGYAVHDAAYCPSLDGRIAAGQVDAAQVITAPADEVPEGYHRKCHRCGEQADRVD